MEEFFILIDIVSDIYGLTLEELKTKTRKREYVELRYVCTNLLLKYSDLDLDKIGSLLNIDRTTTYNAIKVDKNSHSNKSNCSYKDKYNKLQEEFVNKLQSPSRLMDKINALKKEKSILEDNIKNLETILESKLNKIEV